MRFLLLAVCLCTTGLAQAQRVGGGEADSSESIEKMQYKLSEKAELELIAAFNKTRIKCLNPVKKLKNINELYKHFFEMKVAGVLKNNSNADCDEVHAIKIPPKVACFVKGNRETLSKFTEQAGVTKYLVKRYSLSSEEAKSIVEYMKEINSGTITVKNKESDLGVLGDR